MPQTHVQTNRTHLYQHQAISFCTKTIGIRVLQSFTLVNLQPEHLADQSLVKHSQPAITRRYWKLGKQRKGRDRIALPAYEGNLAERKTCKPSGRKHKEKTA
eukprot:1154834-Pelagomonas_calceolata.AAC.1